MLSNATDLAYIILYQGSMGALHSSQMTSGMNLTMVTPGNVTVFK